MTLADLDHAISTLEHSATADAVSETLEFLRGLRERAQEVWALEHELDDPDDPYVTAYRSPGHPHLQSDSPWCVTVPALLIPAEDS